MSETLVEWRDAGIGEARQALVRDGRPIALHVLRAIDEGKRALWGETYVGRVRSVDRRLRGAFVDLGLKEEQGFLPLDAQGGAQRGGASVPVREGELLSVLVTREGARGKGPVLQLLNEAAEGAARRMARHESDEDLLAARPADMEARARLDEAFEAALAPFAQIPSGGTLKFEPTAALVAIDVDAGARKGSPDAERFAFELNVAAAQEIARQVRLRNLGGVIAIDFVSMRQHANREALEDAVKAAFAGDPWQTQFGRLSKFGVFEMSRAQLRAPLHELYRDAEGRESLDFVAAKALREIERAGAAQGGRRIEARVSDEVMSWLENAPYDWRAGLDQRIGPRWRIAGGAPARERIDVSAN
ncbi:MAG: ribonuclease E/G [Hyphomonadaceae bacterium]